MSRPYEWKPLEPIIVTSGVVTVTMIPVELSNIGENIVLIVTLSDFTTKYLDFKLWVN